MQKLEVFGANKLKGQIKISGSKNASLPILAATDHTEFEFGISIFLSVVINPLSIKYPSLVFLGDKSLTFSSLSKATLYSLKVKSSIAAPFKEIEPIMFWFSN